MKRHHVHHIHAQFARRACTFSMLISMMTGIPYSFSAHAHDIYASDALDISSHIKSAKFVVTCTKYNKTYLLEKYGNHGDGKIFSNYHGVDTQVFGYVEKSGNPSLSILSIRRLVEKKGYPYLIKAISILNGSTDSPISVSIVGEGPEYERLEQMAREYKVGHLITFKGSLTTEEVREQFDGADMFVSPSIIANNGDRDGIPNVILEAMSRGTPVISTHVSGIPEVITDGVEGLLVPPRDAEALARAIRRLGEDGSLRKKIVGNARKKMVDCFEKAERIDELAGLFLRYIE